MANTQLSLAGIVFASWCQILRFGIIYFASSLAAITIAIQTFATKNTSEGIYRLLKYILTLIINGLFNNYS